MLKRHHTINLFCSFTAAWAELQNHAIEQKRNVVFNLFCPIIPFFYSALGATR
ncbi:hypothetical protein BT96DRAFT_920621 [Gymnopus androsaceus JB14]|uniref:Uncharacterized protein n=1 Tax=Gymnopus androsaceus JB14 TaxID=1447944 RepID=A0A6A4HNZ2_9AGAR|nr:hypothetical protein BT96DRAFT_920621 [Gymnopus androsaceus JB14]